MSSTITPTVFYRTLNLERLEIFYREAGPRQARVPHEMLEGAPHKRGKIVLKIAA